MLNSASTHHESLSGEHIAFLRRVTEDDRFRTALETDPQATMAEYGIQVELGQIPSKVRIPAAESILDILVDVEDDGQTDSDRIGDSDEVVWFGFLGSRS